MIIQMLQVLHPCLLLLTTLVLAVPTPSQAWNARVTSVQDGDSITVDHDGQPERIRLFGIDCPEDGQEFSSAAKTYTSRQALDKTVDVSPITKDKYGRTVAKVHVESEDLQQLLVRNGFAWVYDQYCNRFECSHWLELQGRARAAKVGLWAASNPTPPWEWRKGVTVGSSTGECHGNKESKIFHKWGCRFYNCQNCSEKFSSAIEATKAGFQPCKICKP